MSRDVLPNELLWEEGHASELALSAIADGEDALLSRDVVAHAHSCDACAQKLGATALVTRGVTHAVTSVKPWLPAELQAPSRTVKRTERMPLGALVAAVIIAVVGATPSLLALPRHVATFVDAMVHAVPALTHGGLQVMQHGLGGAWVSATCACTVLLVVAGVAFVRLLPRPTTS
jgi:hypothetical protein